MSTGFRRFRITRKVKESAIISSFYLAPVDGEPVWSASAGQYLTLRIPADQGTVLKTYSISTDVANTDETRISVKRESAPADAPDVPVGQGSSWLHDHADIGTELEIAAPRGSFVLDQGTTRPVVLLSGGVGQTPLLSMLHSLAHSERQVWYVHACENGEVHAMHDEVSRLVAESNGRLNHHVCYRAPTDKDQQTRRFHSTGVIDKSLLQSLLPIDDYDCYLCGPTPFMVALYRLLSELGIPDPRIRYEFFGKAKSLPTLAAEFARQALNPPSPRSESDAAGSRAPAALRNLSHLTDPDARAAHEEIRSRAEDPAASKQTPRDAHASPANGSTGMTLQNRDAVVFARSGVTVQWSDSVESLLDLAEFAGLAPAFSCRSGICNTCQCGILEGAVEYVEEPLEEPLPGTVLICCSRPKGRVMLDL